MRTTPVKEPSTEGYGFISYRRDENDAMATLLADKLKRVLPGWTFFLDFGAIPPGTDFKTVIDDGLAKSDLLIVLMRENWIGARANGTARISDPGDFVRHEVATALARGIRILPVLVNDAKMPPAAVLPPDIAGLRGINAIDLRVGRIDDDFPRLVEAISGEPMRRDFASLPVRIAWWAGGALVAAILGVLMLWGQSAVSGRPLGAVLGSDTAAAVVSGVWLLIGGWIGDIVRRRWF